MQTKEYERTQEWIQINYGLIIDSGLTVCQAVRDGTGGFSIATIFENNPPFFQGDVNPNCPEFLPLFFRSVRMELDKCSVFGERLSVDAVTTVLADNPGNL